MTLTQWPAPRSRYLGDQKAGRELCVLEALHCLPSCHSLGVSSEHSDDTVGRRCGGMFFIRNGRDDSTVLIEWKISKAHNY